MNRSKRIFFLLLINLILAFLSLYVLDFLQVIDYKQLLRRVPLFAETETVKIEDPLLLEEMELEKKWQILDEQRLNFSNDMEILAESNLQLALEWERVEEEQQNIDDLIAAFEAEQASQEEYDIKIAEIADQINQLAPNVGVLILEKQDDLMIADIWEKLDELAEDNGTLSQVPALIPLMDPEQVARVQRKMLQDFDED